MNIGVTVSDACQAAFKDVNLARKNRFQIFQIENKKEVVPKQFGDRAATLEDFFKVLIENTPAYGVFDYEWKDNDGCQKSKVVFVSYVPDTLKPMDKMMYAGSKAPLMQALQISQDIHMASPGDVTEENIKKHVCK
eukprot:CAMPEP_0174849918 /NCGR_PEP_ID=MMETSP1114-20130205/18198_1 /TAXON_ID=312471 /ORGANISM="Neobodo designis, Strain CCAP 1951/1" /LENGTH=135 /DNA_ID=CAMNT_0016084333 /DNA_START=33 /DNA_END=440 /DNA_ORIENTATION=+